MPVLHSYLCKTGIVREAVKKTGRRNNENDFSSSQRGKHLASFPLMQFFFLVLFIGKLSARQTAVAVCRLSD